MFWQRKIRFWVEIEERVSEMGSEIREFEEKNRKKKRKNKAKDKKTRKIIFTKH